MSEDARVPHSHWVASRGGLPFGNYALFRRRCPRRPPVRHAPAARARWAAALGRWQGEKRAVCPVCRNESTRFSHLLSRRRLCLIIRTV
eukprot:COSAG06_NODE_4028_length_4644_cov_11.949188_2_plen_89_part_00